MSLLKQAAPSKTRKNKHKKDSEPVQNKPSDIEEGYFFPDSENKPIEEQVPSNAEVVKTIQDIDAIEIKTEEPKGLVDKYKFNLNNQNDDFKETRIKLDVAEVQEVQETFDVHPNSVTFLDLIYFCEIYIIELLTQPINIKLEKLRKLEMDYIHAKLNMFADESKDFNFGPISDTVYFKDGIIILTEELMPISGLFREFFNVDKILVITRGGQLKTEDCLWCHFWTRNRLEGLTSKDQFSYDIFNMDSIQKEECKNCSYVQCSIKNSAQILSAEQKINRL